jgi:hypothetical protein
MTITYDPETKRATHLESGLSVQYLRGGARFQDMEEYFSVEFKDNIVVFRTIVSAGLREAMDQFPNLHGQQMTQKVRDLDLQKFYAQGSDLEDLFKPYVSRVLIDAFMETWWAVVRGMDPNRSKLIVAFNSTIHNAPYHWEYSG